MPQDDVDDNDILSDGDGDDSDVDGDVAADAALPAPEALIQTNEDTGMVISENNDDANQGDVKPLKTKKVFMTILKLVGVVRSVIKRFFQ